MAQIWFRVKGFWVNVSSHGYIIIFSRKLPALKFSSCPSVIFEGSVDVLGHGIKYLPEYDSLNIDLDDDLLERAVEEFVEDNLEAFIEKDKKLMENWKRLLKTKKPLKIGRFEVRINDYVELENGEIVKILWYDEYEIDYRNVKTKEDFGTSIENFKVKRKLKKDEVIAELI